MRLKPFAVALALVASVAVAANLEDADRNKTGSELIQVLNGSPVRVAALSTDGGITANSCTSPAGAGDAGLGDFVMVQCNQDHFIRTGTCSTTATSVNVFLADREKFYTMLRVDEMAIAAIPADAGVVGGCSVYHLK